MHRAVPWNGFYHNDASFRKAFDSTSSVGEASRVSKGCLETPGLSR